MAATQSDDFSGTTLDSELWTAGLWSPLGNPYTPTITNSILTINPNDDAWVRSVNTYTHAILEATAEFTPGVSEHIGFGSGAFIGDRYFLFSTYLGNGDLYARVNNSGSEQNLDLGPIPTGMNRYRIEWTADVAIPGNDLITFYINASQVAQFSVASSGATNFYLYLSNNGAGTLNVDYAQAAPTYQAAGIYTSCPFDAGTGSAWQTLSWDVTQSISTTLSVKTRTSPDGINWKAWSDITNSGDTIQQPDRWMQYQLTLGTSNDNETPLVNSVTRTYGNAQADLSITKSSSASTVDARGVLKYFLNVSNNGPNEAATVTVTDTMPADVINLVASGSGWDCSSSTDTLVRCALSSMPVGNAPVITITVNAPAAGGVISNLASTGSETLDPNLINNTSNTVTNTVTAQADLSIVKAGPAEVDAGGMLTYTLTVNNAGPSAASSLVVSDTLPAGVANASAAGTGWSCGVVSGLATCTLPSLGVGSAPAITISATAPAQAGAIHNKASVSSATADPVANNTSNTVDTNVIGQADLSIVKAGPAEVNAGGVLSYTLSVSNEGPSTASSLVVSDTLPAGVANASAAGTGWSCGVVSGLATCTRPSLGVGSAPAITISATAPAQAGAIHNKASVSSATADPVANNTSNTVDTNVIGQADLSIVKAGPAEVDAGGMLTYTLTVNNAGPSAASSLVVSDTLPAGVTDASAAGTDWSCGVVSGLATCTRPSLGVGSAPAITISATAPAQAGAIHNKASVSSATADPVANNTSNTVDTNVIGQADLSIGGTGSSALVKLGGVLTYTLTVSNTGPSSAQNVIMTYNLPAGVSFTSASGTGWICNLASGMVTCSLQADLGVGAASPITILVHAPSISGPFTNTFAVSSTTVDINLSNNSKEIISTVERAFYLPIIMR